MGIDFGLRRTAESVEKQNSEKLISFWNVGLDILYSLLVTSSRKQQKQKAYDDGIK